MKSIRFKLIITYLLLAMLTVSIAGFLSFFLIIRNASQQEKQYLNLAAHNIAKQLGLISFAETKKLQEVADAAGFFHNVRVKILDQQGNLIIDTVRKPEAMLSFQFFFREKSQDDAIGNRFSKILQENRDLKKKLEEETHINLDDYLIIRKDHSNPAFQFMMQIPGSPPGFMSPGSRPAPPPDTLKPFLNEMKAGKMVVLPVGDPLNPRGFLAVSGGPDFTTAAKATAMNAVIAASLLAIVVSILLGALMGNRISDPLVTLSQAAREMAEGNWDTKVEPAGNDEIGLLAQQFNRMTSKLKESFMTIERERDVLKTFMQDASHHLRTPVTALSTFNELLLAQAGDDEETRKEFLTDSKTQIDKLNWVIDKLLKLSRLDSQVTTPVYKACSFAELIEKAWQSVTALAEQKRITLKSDIRAHADTIECDPYWIETAIANLLENAIQHSKPESFIEVTAGAHNGMWSIMVKDSGTGINEQDIGRIFTRFYRSPDNTNKGSGLGLAIVKSIIESHHGMIEVESAPGEGSAFTITLPESPPGDI